jgi:hypothetical protein
VVTTAVILHPREAHHRVAIVAMAHRVAMVMVRKTVIMAAKAVMGIKEIMDHRLKIAAETAAVVCKVVLTNK